VTRPLPIAILVSGEGTTMDALAELVAEGRLPAELRLVLSDRANAPALEKARRRELPTLVLPSRKADLEEWSHRVTAELEGRGVELVVLAGFLSILPDSWVERWRGRALNLHPSLLPKYGGHGMYGAHVHEAVLAAGEKESGATVQLVTGGVDRGFALVQERVPVLPGDTPATLRARIHPVEVRLLADTIRRFADGALPLPYPDPDDPARGARERSPGAR
jgi:phosphoribosylglycinamide formyltransferase 1